jgi:hypothetical protein
MRPRRPNSMIREPSGDNPNLRSKRLRVGVPCFTEGFPLSVFYDIVPVHFRMQAIDLAGEFEP